MLNVWCTESSRQHTDDKKYHFCLMRFVITDFDLRENRHQNLPRENRVCTTCNLFVIGGEFHFLLECPACIDYPAKPARRIFSTAPKV